MKSIGPCFVKEILNLYQILQCVSAVPDGLKKLGVATSFPVIAENKSTKTRPVCDCRKLNLNMAPSSSRTASNVAMTQKLRSCLRTGYAVCQIDIRKAFLAMMLVGHAVSIWMGTTEYFSDRCIFGLRCGSNALEACVDILSVITDAKVRNNFPDANVNLLKVLDDIVIVGGYDDCVTWRDVFLENLFVCGFQVDNSKILMWNKSTPSRWWGQPWLWDTDKGDLNLIRTLPDLTVPESCSKRFLFKLAGRIQPCSSSYAESAARLFADLIRRVVGAANYSWNEVLPKSIVDVCSKFLINARFILDNAKNEVILLTSCIEKISVFCDASDTAFAFVVHSFDSDDAKNDFGGFDGDLMSALMNKNIVYCESNLFAKSNVSWHANRRESYCLARSIQKVTLAFAAGYFPRLQNVVFLSDNRVATSSSKSRSTDFLSMQRLKWIIADTCRVLESRKVKVDIQHVRGVFNGYADLLSPIFFNLRLNLPSIPRFPIC